MDSEASMMTSSISSQRFAGPDFKDAYRGRIYVNAFTEGECACIVRVLVLCDLNKKKQQEESTPTDRRAVQPSLLHPRSSYAYFLVRHCHLPPVLHHVAAAPNYCDRIKAIHRS